MGSLLDLNQATLRNWRVGRYTGDGANACGGWGSELEEVRALKKRMAEWNKPTRSSRPLRRLRSGGPRPPTQMIVDYIETDRSRFGVEPICDVLSEQGVSVAHSTYYERRRQPVTVAELEDAHLANALVTLWREEWDVYGVLQLWHAARQGGLDLDRGWDAPGWSSTPSDRPCTPDTVPMRREAVTGMVHHSDAGSQGGFDWSSQHPDAGGVRWVRARRSESRSRAHQRWRQR